ncbi:MAG: hypothetical protein JST55_00435 [Bacteroidetes bacterium]|nr:hypothetical protein [Bacteroidota bacterium]
MRIIGLPILFLFFFSNSLFAQKAKQYYYYENKDVGITLSADKISAKYTDSIVFKVVLKNISDDDILYLENGYISGGDKYSVFINITAESNTIFEKEMKKLESGEEKIYYLTLKISNLKEIRNYGILCANLNIQYITDMKRFKKIKDNKRVKWVNENTVVVTTDIINSMSGYSNLGTLNILMSEFK